MEEKCKSDLHGRGCDTCKKALGHMSVRKPGKSNSSSVLSAELSGPHPKAVGTGCTYLFAP
eukprot:12914163-Prorocentrum_lima.AAC.1